MNFADVITADIRLVLLRLLADPEARYTLNSSILHKLLDAKTGYRTTRDKVLTELFWLREQGLLDLKEGIGCTIATINQRGLDVANGATTIPGVNRPSPES